MASLALEPAPLEPRDERKRRLKLLPHPGYALVLSQVSKGHSVRSTCKRLRARGLRVPSVARFFEWAAQSQERYEHFARAIETKTEVQIDQLEDIIDGAFIDEDGNRIDDPAMLAQRLKAAEHKVRLRQWRASKAMPKRYGDKLQHEHTGNVSVNVVTHVPDGVSNKSNRIGYAAGSILDDESPALGITDAVDAAYTLRTTVEDDAAEAVEQAAPLTCAQARALDRAARAGSMLDD